MASIHGGYEERAGGWATARLVALLAFGYLLLGGAGLLLAIPPGYASPVFPAAGLALAAVLRLGWRALPGI